MPKQIEELPLVGIQLNFSSDVPLYKQLYTLLREAILTGRFKGGQKLPGTRTFSNELNISRNTVVQAFEQLIIEGYLTGKIGAGTFITNDIPDKIFDSRKTQPSTKNKIKSTNFNIGKKNVHSNLIHRNIFEDKIIPFQNGLPSLEDFPFSTWLKIINRNGTYLPYLQFGYKDSTGYKPLKDAVANYLQTYRAVNCTAEQIVIINGSQQGLDLISRVMLKEKKNVLLEDPGYFGTRASVLSAKVNIFPVPVDEDGINIDYAIKNYPKSDFIYTTPSHQFPLGTTLSISRRLKLLEYAKKNNAWIIEDDYDSEFRYNGSPLPSLQGMDKFNRILYIGTFSKVLFPGLRLGYLVLPSVEMVEPFAVAKSIADRQSPIFDQIVLSKFIEEGHFTKHIRKMRMLYKERQDFLIDEIKKEIGNLLKVNPSNAGMHIVAWLPEKYNDKKVSSLAKENNLIVYPLSEYKLRFNQKPALVIGYTGFNKNKLKAGVFRLKKILTSYKN
ncbi:MAG: PLP-dependent aminotransferase family protein [Bacteroidetes bacterium]|nr:PLP-dependent aminotransferase family protein [Bacteroidota bacterium]